MQRRLSALRQMSLHGKGVRVGLRICCIVFGHRHECGVGVLDVPLVERKLAKVRLPVGERTCGRGNGGAALDAREGDLDIAVARHADGDAAVEVIRVKECRLVHVAFRKRGNLKDRCALVISGGGELFARGIARCERNLGTRDGRILVGDVDHDHTKHGARENEHLEGVFFVGKGLGWRKRQYERV